MTEHWRPTEHIAWTERDGAGRTPWAPGAGTWLAVGAALTAVLGVITFSDTLCPEHRAWVQVLGATSIFAAGASLAGVARRSSWAPIGTIVAAGGGVAIGILDAAHAPGRGWLVAALFAAVGLGAGLLATRQLALTRWERSTVSPLLASAPVAEPATIAEPATAAEATPEPADAPAG